MNKITLTALKKSIIKWQKIVDGEGLDSGKSNCALCEVFYYKGIGCYPCPVSLKAKEPFCANTHYVAWSKHQGKTHDIDWSCCARKVHENCSECLKIAKDELKFLKSLLPRKDIK